MRAHGLPQLARRSAPERRAQRGARSAAVAALTAVLLGGCAGGRPSERRLLIEGSRVFVSAGCGRCHAVASLHTHGQVGPDFDTSEQLNLDQIRAELDYGDGVMPSFRDRLTAEQLAAVTQFVFDTLHDGR